MTELENLLAQEKTWNATRRTKLAELADLEASGGGELADGADLMTVARRMTTLRDEIRLTETTIVTIRTRRAAAITTAQRDEAADLRRQAQEKRAQIQRIREQTAPLLAKLSELEGVAYDHTILYAQRAGGDWQIIPQLGEPPSLAMASPAEVANMRPLYACPRSRQLEDEACQLEKQAAVIEGKISRPQAGHADGATLEEILAGVYARADVLAPPEVEVAKWIATIQARLSEKDLRGRSVRYKLAWLGDRIDAAHSHAEISRPFSPGLPAETYRATAQGIAA